jgi:hypothetical protein
MLRTINTLTLTLMILANTPSMAAAALQLLSPYGGSSCGASTFATALDANGVLTCSASTTTLNGIAAAAGANTIANGDNAQVWQWSISTANKIAFRFTESAASTATGTPVLFQLDTVAASNALPFLLRARGAEIVRVSPAGTWSWGLGSAATTARLGQPVEFNVSANSGGMAFSTWSATAAQGPVIDFNRSLSNTVGTFASTADGTVLGGLNWCGVGNDTSGFTCAGGTSGQLTVYQAGAPVGAFAVPTNMRFTIANNVNGASVEVMRLTQSEHIVSAATAPTVSACGTSPSIAATSTDMSGTITVGTGGTATPCTVTFARTWLVEPQCTAMHEGAILLVRAVATTTTLTIDASSPFTAGGLLKYQCSGNI